LFHTQKSGEDLLYLCPTFSNVSPHHRSVTSYTIHCACHGLPQRLIHVFSTQVASSAFSWVQSALGVEKLDSLLDDDSCLSPVRRDGGCFKYVAARLASLAFISVRERESGICVGCKE